MKIKELNCPNCGAKIKKGQSECAYCGTKLDFEELQAKQAILSAPIIAVSDVRTIVQEEMANRDISAPTSAEAQIRNIAQEVEESAKIAEEIATEKKAERKHRAASITVSAVSAVAAITGGILLLGLNVYVGIALIAFGILRACKIFYTFMRASYNMTPAGYTYSGVICAIISGLGIYGGIELLVISPTISGKILCVIPFLLAVVSIGYFVTKTVFYIKKKRGK